VAFNVAVVTWLVVAVIAAEVLGRRGSLPWPGA
jgi:hypothetical protein